MSLREHFDVVVIGYGLAGATAALAAAQANARVLILHQGVVTEPRSARKHALRAALRPAARETGVEVWAQCHVHELITEAGKVCGVGYATMPAQSLAAAAHQWLQRMSEGAPARIATVLADAAEAVWRSAFRVDEISCSSVILAMGPRHWEFVGPAAWSAARAGASSPGPPREASSPAGPMPELAVRAWCAARERAGRPQTELRVDERTGAVLVGEDQPVPGLYAAIQEPVAGICAGLVAGRQAGNGAAAGMTPRTLTSVTV